MYDITLGEFPPDRLAAIVHWRNDPVVNRYLRQGIRTLEEVQQWYTQYFSRAENKLFAVSVDKRLIGYGTLEHIDTTHRSGEIGIVIGNPDYWNKGVGALVVTRLTTLAFTIYHLHRLYAMIHGDNIGPRSPRRPSYLDDDRENAGLDTERDCNQGATSPSLALHFSHGRGFGRGGSLWQR